MDISIAFVLQIAAFIFVLAILKSGFRSVPQNQAYTVERFGKYLKTMEAGLNFLIPLIDQVSAKRNLKEQAENVPEQSAITKDNITLLVDGVLYFRVLDPYKATYGVDDYVFAVTQLAQTTMRSEIGKMELDKSFEERDTLNANIVSSINEAAGPWGVQVLRYEIKDITPPTSVMESMERQMKAEREKRAKILESEGDRQAAINTAEGEKQSRVLAAEGDKQEQILAAEGEATAILSVAEAQAKALDIVGKAAATDEGAKAIQFDLAVKAIAAKAAIAKESTVVLLPESGTDASSMVAQAMAIINATGQVGK
jgi:regulator of protease activity HflC (stomatin/prohibitin superfamily)